MHLPQAQLSLQAAKRAMHVPADEGKLLRAALLLTVFQHMLVASWACSSVMLNDTTLPEAAVYARTMDYQDDMDTIVAYYPAGTVFVALPPATCREPYPACIAQTFTSKHGIVGLQVFPDTLGKGLCDYVSAVMMTTMCPWVRVWVWTYYIGGLLTAATVVR